MPVAHFLRRWIRPPGGIALALGMGALSIASARAGTPEDRERISPGDVSIRSERGKVYLSEGGQETELSLGATPQRDHLLRLLEKRGPAGVTLDPDPRLIMSGGGGAGFSLWDSKKPVTDKPPPVPQDPPPAVAPRNEPEKGSTPRDRRPTTDGKG